MFYKMDVRVNWWMFSRNEDWNRNFKIYHLCFGIDIRNYLRIYSMLILTTFQNKH